MGLGLGLCNATGSIRYMQCSSSSNSSRALPRDGFDGGTSPSLSLNSHVFHVWSFWMIQQAHVDTHTDTWTERDRPKRIRKTEPGVQSTRSNHHNLVLLLALSQALELCFRNPTRPSPHGTVCIPTPPPSLSSFSLTLMSPLPLPWAPKMSPDSEPTGPGTGNIEP